MNLDCMHEYTRAKIYVANVICLVLALIQETFVMRVEEKKERDERRERMVSSLLTDFPCFEYGEYLMEELRLILTKSDKDMDKLYRESKFALDAIVKIMPENAFIRTVWHILNFQ